MNTYKVTITRGDIKTKAEFGTESEALRFAFTILEMFGDDEPHEYETEHFVWLTAHTPLGEVLACVSFPLDF